MKLFRMEHSGYPFWKNLAKMLQPFPGVAHSFVYIKTSLLLSLKAETRWPRKEMRKFVREKKLHQHPSAKASGLAHCRVFEEPETRRGG